MVPPPAPPSPAAPPPPPPPHVSSSKRSAQLADAAQVNTDAVVDSDASVTRTCADDAPTLVSGQVTFPNGALTVSGALVYLSTEGTAASSARV